MYATVPGIIPACVAAMLMVGESSVFAVGVPPIFASPKSSTFTLPSGRILTLPGLRSRCGDAFLVRGFEHV